MIALGQITLVQVEDGRPGDVGESLGMGTMLLRDPTFLEGTNRLSLYNNGSDKTTVVVHRVPREADNPTASTHQMRIVVNGTAAPGLGGVYHPILSRPNAVFLQKFIAKIPVGYRLEHASNRIGDEARHTFLTPVEGTGKYETYLLRRTCGATGTFSSTGHLYLNGPAATPDAPVAWDIAYATAYDMTAREDNLLLDDLFSDQKVTPDEKRQLKIQWDAITGEYAQLSRSAALYGVGTSGFATACNALRTLLTPLLSQLTVTSTGDFASITTALATYSSARASLQEEIAKAADKVQDQVNAIFSDSKVTPDEKQQLKIQWNNAYSEYPIILRTAALYGVSVAAYTANYTALGNMLAPLFASMTTTSTSVGSFDAISAKFAAYKEAKTALEAAIAKQMANDIGSTGEQVDNLVPRLESCETNISDTEGRIKLEVATKYVSGELFEEYKTTALEQTDQKFEFNFKVLTDSINQVNDYARGNQTLIEEYIRFTGALIELGRKGNAFVAKLSNTELAFYENGNRIAYISNQRLHITDAEIGNSLKIGKFAWKPRANGNLSLVFVG